MADEAVGWMKQLNDIDPSIPFMIYYAPGATHSPHHPTPEWIKKISDMRLFDKGFEAVREQIFANQKKLGVIPPDAKLTHASGRRRLPDSVPVHRQDRQARPHARAAEAHARGREETQGGRGRGRRSQVILGPSAPTVTTWNPTFADVVLQLGVGVELCWPYMAWQKGSIENLVGWVKGSFFKPRRFLDDADLTQ
jgi:hypothetical protein